MGVGGSTSSRPGSASVLVKSRPPSNIPSRSGTAHTHSNATQHRSDCERPTGSCCSHFSRNHAALTRTVTPASSDTPPPPNDSVDDDIEEIVANTVDLVSNPRTEKTSNSPLGGERDVPTQMVDFASAKRDREEIRGSAAGSGIELRRTLTSGTRIVQKRPSDEMSDEQDETQFDAKDSIPEVDFAKFKRVNHRGTTIAPNGRIMHHQESDLLWRLGLISPEAYKMNAGPRSAPSNQGPYLKTPSYDLTEEQLMANIEKEFEVTTAI